MVKVAKITRIVAPTLVFISMALAIVAVATGDSIPWLVGENVEGLNNQVPPNEIGDDVANDPFIQQCTLDTDNICNGVVSLIIQLEFYLGRSYASYCSSEFGVDCEGSNDFPQILDRSYSDYLFDEKDQETAFVMVYDGCDIGSTTVLVTVSLSVVLMFGSLVLDALSFKRRFDKPRVSTFLLVLGWAFSLAALISWVLTCQNTATSLYPEITIGTGFIFLVVSIGVGFFAGAVRILRVSDFKYQQQVYI